MRIALLTAIISVFMVDVAAAQDRTVPMDLVLGLFADEMGPDSVSFARILVGKAPDDLKLPNLKLPVLGAFVHELGAIVVYRITGDSKKTYAFAKEQMRAAGWQLMQIPDVPPPDAGFSGTELHLEEFAPMCREGMMALIQMATIQPGLHVLRIAIDRADGCAEGANSVGLGFAVPTEQTPLPKLEPPKGSEVFGSMGQVTVASFVTNAFVLSDLTTAQLIDHYGAQMHAAGWSSRGGTAGETTSVHTWRLARDGTEWLASMAFTRLPQRRHVVEISVYNLSRLTR